MLERRPRRCGTIPAWLTEDDAVRGFINGHYGNDVMVGGTGADVFEGGPGVDKVDYSQRLGEHITGTPGTGSDDGRPGEGDNVMADVEQVLFPPG